MYWVKNWVKDSQNMKKLPSIGSLYSIWSDADFLHEHLFMNSQLTTTYSLHHKSLIVKQNMQELAYNYWI